ncbi:PREDICTED: syndecan-like [Polistes canadensis]|uniref:syndecan-like n=1 Tax=Polistes canadensis TaxID=91411 RepID=UPI000718DCF9|nr:PREDICTED: syndecan-like [Polistes canadensis]
MRRRILWILVSTAVILTECNATTEKEQNEKGERTLGSSSNYNSFPDDLYLDDQEASEGSGRGGSEGRDDLEASGSGLGPDDEDGDDEHEFDSNNNRIEPVPNKPIEPKEPYIDESNNNNKVQTNVDTINRLDEVVDVIEPSTGEDDHVDNTDDSHVVYIMNPKHEDRASSFFAQPGVLAAVIGGAVVGLLCAILVVMFIVYRMRKKDEGSYALDEPRRSPAAQAFPKPGAPHHNREFYA